jgi:hypothetical protein
MLLKFGKKEHLEKLLAGELRMTPAKVYQEIEKAVGKKGMGDEFDSYLKFRVNSVEMTAPGFSKKLSKIDTQIICEDCERIPMICFYYSQVKNINDFSISAQDLIRLRTDFENPDSILIIEDEDDLYRNVGASLGDIVFTSEVTYLHDNILNFDATSFLKFIDGFPSKTPFSSPVDDGSCFCSFCLNTGNDNRDFVINRTNSYQTMFFKHHYFVPQHELRMVIPKLLSDDVVTKDINPISRGFIRDFNFLNNFNK